MRMRRMQVGMAVAVAVVLGILGVAPPRAEAAAAPTSVDVQLSDQDPELGQTISIRATVRRSVTARPTGTITFLLDGTTTLATAKLRATAAPRDSVLVWTRALPTGTHEISAVYSGDTRYASASDRRGVEVLRGATTTSLRSARPEVPSGATARFIARVAPVAPATTTPTGTVEFRTGDLVRSVALVKGVAEWRPRLPDGIHEVTARFEGGDVLKPSASGPVSQEIGPPGPRVDQQDTTRSGSTIAFSPSGPYRAATQIVVAGATGLLTAVEVDGGCFGGIPGPGGTGDLPVEIRSPIGDAPTGPLLAAGAEPSTYDDDLDLARYELSTPVPVTVGTRFAIVLTAPANVMACEVGMATSGASTFSLGGVWEGRVAAIRHRTWVAPA